MRVGLTGGIGSGKSTVVDMLADMGAAVVDADEIARRVVAPGSSVLERLAEKFGSEILLEDGTLDRALLAARAFADERGTRRLNEITHPAIREQAERDISRAEETSEIVVYEMPLLVESGQVSLVDVVVVVDVPESVQIDRAVRRGMDETDVRQRLGIAVADPVWLPTQLQEAWVPEQDRKLAKKLAAQRARLRGVSPDHPDVAEPGSETGPALWA